MKEAKSSYCGECLRDFEPNELVWYSFIENRCFCKDCKPKLNILEWELRKVPERRD